MFKKPYIARDTKEPLVILGGYAVDSTGGVIRPPVIPTPPPKATEADIKMLKELGRGELRRRQLFGVIDRLRTSKLID